MRITIIRLGGNIEQILIGPVTNIIKDWVRELNNNPLISEECSYEERYSDRSLYDLQKFFNVD